MHNKNFTFLIQASPLLGDNFLFLWAFQLRILSQH
ncbi:hypothetical protein SAMN04490243_0534 [Robiginitalea myxolifaciens]|uniref:Uncharacterized protein n=1 Tax=Robiginitalea myxolifaciens TaxID=400055 RepID=A0A1I6FRW0_9FLAO|nr:hypothetical protein SAMN04490243_0534 [Robiginitalea myxolifaciens]